MIHATFQSTSSSLDLSSALPPNNQLSFVVPAFRLVPFPRYSVTMSGPVNIGSAAEWQSLLSDTNVVIADCNNARPSPLTSRTQLTRRLCARACF